MINQFNKSYIDIAACVIALMFVVYGVYRGWLRPWKRAAPRRPIAQRRRTRTSPVARVIHNRACKQSCQEPQPARTSAEFEAEVQEFMRIVEHAELLILAGSVDEAATYLGNSIEQCIEPYELLAIFEDTISADVMAQLAIKLNHVYQGQKSVKKPARKRGGRSV